MPGQWWNWAADVLLEGLWAVPRTGGHLPKRVHWNKNCSRFLQCSHRSPCSRAGEGVAGKRGGGQGRAAEWERRAKSLGSKAWPETGARVSQPPCHLSKILRQCSGLRKPRGVLCSLFFRTFPSNVFFFKSLYWVFFFYNTVSVPCFIFFVPEAYGIWAPWPGMGPSPPALEGESNHWTATEVPFQCLFSYQCSRLGERQEEAHSISFSSTP